MPIDPVWVMVCYGSGLSLLVAGCFSAAVTRSRMPLFICGVVAIIFSIVSMMVIIDITDAPAFGAQSFYSEYVSIGIGEMFRHQAAFCLVVGLFQLFVGYVTPFFVDIISYALGLNRRKKT